MNKMIKMVLAAAIAVITALALVGCGAGSGNKEVTENPQVLNTERDPSHNKDKGSKTKSKNDGKKVDQRELKTEIAVSAEDCINNGAQVLLASQDTTVNIMANESKRDVNWKIYVLDDKTDRPFEEVMDQYEPALASGGNIKVKKGQYIYVVFEGSAESAVNTQIKLVGDGLSR